MGKSGAFGSDCGVSVGVAGTHGERGTRSHSFQCSGMPEVDGNADYFIAQFHDITELRAAQVARRVSDERYKNLLDQLPVALCRVQVDGTILAVNDALRTMMGSSHDDD